MNTVDIAGKDGDKEPILNNVREIQKKPKSNKRIIILPLDTENVVESRMETKRNITPNKANKSNLALVSKRITRQSPKLNSNKLKEKQTVAKKDELIPPEDEVFFVEALLEKRGHKYLVKWENHPERPNSGFDHFGLILPVFGSQMIKKFTYIYIFGIRASIWLI